MKGNSILRFSRKAGSLRMTNKLQPGNPNNMLLTFSQFAKEKKTTINCVQVLADRFDYRFIDYAGHRFQLMQDGTFPNGKQRYFVVVEDGKDDTGTGKKGDGEKQKRHLNPDEKEAALSMLNDEMARRKDAAAWDAIKIVAEKFGVSNSSIFRLWRYRSVDRKSRADKGSTKKIIPQQALEMFEGIYIQNAQGPNVKLAYNLTRRQFEGFDLPIRYFRARAKEIEPERLAFHQQSKFEQKYTPRVRRDLWAEFEFLDSVSLDGWTVPDRVLHKFGLGEMTKNKFQFGGKDVSMVCVFAFDSKTGYPLAWKAFEKSVTADDVLSVLLDVVYNWGRPTSWLLDNGAEFTNEPVQRFLRGLYSTDEHSAKSRIIFSEPYQPYGKGRHERQHRIFKDEFNAFSRSYSPNALESRKPTRELSYVKPTHTLAEWVESFSVYLNGYYREAERASWLNPKFGLHAPENADRPRTLNDAFEQAYRTFVPTKIDSMKLAFLYAKKFRATLKNGLFITPKSISQVKYVYLPEGEGIPFERYQETFEIVVNPRNLCQSWICDLNGNYLCEAWDLQGKNSSSAPTRQVAAEYRKRRNQMVKHMKRAAAAKAELVEMEQVMKGKKAAKDRVEVRNIEDAIYATKEELNKEATDFADMIYGLASPHPNPLPEGEGIE
jgi:transposase InsO family protein